VAGAVLVKAVPSALDDSTNFRVNGRVDVTADSEPGEELLHVAVGVEKMDVVAVGSEVRTRVTERGAILGEHKQIVVEFVREVHRRITGLRFRSPDLWWDVDDKGGGGD
jgi:hypothetical protein